MSSRILATLMAIALLAVACGDTDGDAASTATPAAVEDEVTAADTAPVPSDEVACEAVWDFYEIINPTDEFADRALRAAAAKAETTQAREIIEQEARYWRDGVPTWDEGAIDFCIGLM